MCCRYGTEKSPLIGEIIEDMRRSPLMRIWQKTAEVKELGDVRPTDVVPVIAPDQSGARAVFPMRWGYTGRTLLINARTETAAEKPTFQADWIRHRCIVPASWYYEWRHYVGTDGKKHTGEKYRIWTGGSQITWLCGLYRIEDGLPHFVILTREAGEEMQYIHDRMPLIMPETMITAWIRPEEKPEELLAGSLTDMVFEKAV